MSYDETLASHVRDALAASSGRPAEESVPDGAALREIKMFGGLCFMVRGHMCCGVLKDELIVRVGPSTADRALSKPHTRPMDFTGKPMKGLVVVEPEGLTRRHAVEDWLDLALEFVRTLPPRAGKARAASRRKRELKGRRR